jgi:hypothetical protein
VSQTGNANFERLDQSNGWNGNFANGAPLLWDQAQGPVITIDLGTLSTLSGGAQIQADFFGAFTAKLEAFDSSGNSLGFVTENGNSNSNGDNSAIFIGVLSTGAPISKFQFSLTSAASSPNDFAINQFSFVPELVPEPPTLALFGTVIGLGFGGWLWRRRRQAVPSVA